jgi:hypothetical protein
VPDVPADLAALESYARDLSDAVEAALPDWVERVVREQIVASGLPVRAEDMDAARRAGADARRIIGGQVRALLSRDVDDQPTGPLDVLRGAVRFPTEVLAAAGVRQVDRDEVARRLHPDDVYDLSPSRFADIAPELQELGIAWGAAKAHIVLARRRREGKR